MALPFQDRLKELLVGRQDRFPFPQRGGTQTSGRLAPLTADCPYRATQPIDFTAPGELPEFPRSRLAGVLAETKFFATVSALAALSASQANDSRKPVFAKPTALPVEPSDAMDEGVDAARGL